jgi:hypothetical protein
MCNLYSITTNQAAIIALMRVFNRYVGNLAPMPGVFPDYPAPVVRNTDTGSELSMMRWGTSKLFQLYRYPTDGGPRSRADLCTQLQNHTIRVLQLNASTPCRAAAGCNCAVSALNRSRLLQIESASDKSGCRGPNREADVRAGCSEWISFAAKGQLTHATGNPDDESPFVKRMLT